MRSLLAVLIASAAVLAAPRWSLAQENEAAEGAAAEHHAGAHHDPGHGNAGSRLNSMIDVRTDLAVYTFAVFLLLLAILSFTAWPKISQALLEREKRIEANIAAAEAKHEEAKRLLAEHEAKLATAAGEVRALLEEARRDAEAAREAIIAEGRKAAQAERDRAIREIDTAKNQALQSLAEKTADVAIEIAGKVIRESINAAKQQELVRHALERMNAGNN